MIEAGFEDIKEEVYKLPQSPWPKDPKFKVLGRYHQVNIFEGMGSYSYALFTRYLGWRREEIDVLLAGVRNELKDMSIHNFTKVYMVYGRKPQE